MNTKKLFPEYTDIHSQVLQNCIERVKKAFDRYLKADASGKCSGKPRFKGRGRYRSFTYPQIKQNCIQNNRITLPMIGEVKIIVHRPIPDGFKIKTAQVIKAADGYYINLTLEDKSVPKLALNLSVENAVGIDMELKDFLITSDSKTVPIPKFARKAERDNNKKLNKAVFRKQRASNRRRKAVALLAKHHQKVARQRQKFHYNTAKELVRENDIIAYEDLNIKSLAKTKMAQSILDAGSAPFADTVIQQS